MDIITLREPDSQAELLAMGVTVPNIILTADPALTLSCASDDAIDSVMLRAGVPPRGRYLCFALRKWRGFEEKAPLFGRAAQYAYETYGLTPVFMSVEKHQDPGANQLAAQGLTIPHYFLDDAGGAGTIIGALSRMEAVVSMRLHALIFAAGQGIPLAGVVYDPKVSAFLRYIGQDLFVDLDTLTDDMLHTMIDRAVARSAHPEMQAAAVQHLQDLEQNNVAAAGPLFWNCDSAASFHHLLQNHPETVVWRFRDGFLIAGFLIPLQSRILHRKNRQLLAAVPQRQQHIRSILIPLPQKTFSAPSSLPFPPAGHCPPKGRRP